jgi:hypothetical protein
VRDRLCELGVGTVTKRTIVVRKDLIGERSPQTFPGPYEQLSRKMAPAVTNAVDELHVAALLESTGVTDMVAREIYGYRDVFALAETLYRRRPVTDKTSGHAPPVAKRSRKGLRALAHGPLYMLPSTVYPAVFIALGTSTVFRVLVFTTALGWVWGMGVSTVAYQLVGQGMERSAGRAIRLLSLVGLAIALLSGTIFAATGPGGAGLTAFVVAQVGFQLMSGVLVFHGKELRLALTMLPALLVGLFFLVSGSPAALVIPTLATGGLCVVLLTVTALVTSMRAPVRPDTRNQMAFARTFAGASPSVCYAALCALYFLGTEARFLADEGSLAIAAVPLILGMGVLEWRAHSFTEKTGELFRGSTTSVEFRGAAWRLLLAELTNCLVILGSLGVIFLVVLIKLGLLSGQDSLMADAYVLLGGVFFLGFVMARHQQFARLLGLMLPVVLAEFLLADRYASQGQVEIFLISTVILLLLQVAALRASFRRVQRYHLPKRGDYNARSNTCRRSRGSTKALHDRTAQATNAHWRGVRYPRYHLAAIEGTRLHAGYYRHRISWLADSRVRRRWFPLGTGYRLLRRGEAAIHDRATAELPRSVA